jgi:hypothetical protein
VFILVNRRENRLVASQVSGLLGGCLCAIVNSRVHCPIAHVTGMLSGLLASFCLGLRPADVVNGVEEQRPVASQRFRGEQLMLG